MKKLFFLLAYLSSTALFADVAAEAPAQSIWPTVSMVVIAVFFFYFILWRPEQKRRKQMESVRSSMKKGDRVTAMGIVGTVAKNPEGPTVILKMVDGSQIEVLKASISEVHPSTDSEPESSSKRVDLPKE
ncbi:MAG: preprotein translocase subunit YajC [Chlamydiota bacterium]